MAKHNQNEQSICDVLLTRFIPEQPLISRKIVTTSENGVRYKAVINPERETIVFQVDNYIIVGGNKCDRLLLTKHLTDANACIGHFVELKGCDIHHALEQLEQSVQHATFSHQTLKKKCARIVGGSFPANAGNPEFERARNKFRQQYQCELKRLKSDQPDRI